jgi:hypothetical protein
VHVRGTKLEFSNSRGTKKLLSLLFFLHLLDIWINFYLTPQVSIHVLICNCTMLHCYDRLNSVMKILVSVFPIFADYTNYIQIPEYMATVSVFKTKTTNKLIKLAKGTCLQWRWVAAARVCQENGRISISYCDEESGDGRGWTRQLATRNCKPANWTTEEDDALVCAPPKNSPCV